MFRPLSVAVATGSLLVVVLLAATHAAQGSALLALPDAVTYIAKQTARTNKLHPSRVFYPGGLCVYVRVCVCASVCLRLCVYA